MSLDFWFCKWVEELRYKKKVDNKVEYVFEWFLSVRFIVNW